MQSKAVTYFKGLESYLVATVVELWMTSLTRWLRRDLYQVMIMLKRFVFMGSYIWVSICVKLCKRSSNSILSLVRGLVAYESWFKKPCVHCSFYSQAFICSNPSVCLEQNVKKTIFRQNNHDWHGRRKK